MNPTTNLLAQHQASKKHRGILFHRLPNSISLGFTGLVLSIGLITCLAAAKPPPLPVSRAASVALRLRSTTTNNESGAQPQVLSAQVALPNNSIDLSALNQQVESVLNSYLAQGKFKGEKGDKGDTGEPGTTVVTSSGNPTTVSIGGYPLVSYYASQPSTGFTGGSMAGITFLSSNSFVAEHATVNSQLTVAGPATLASSVALATTTASSLTVSGPAIFSGTTTIAGLDVTGLNPGFTLGSVAFQGAAGLTQDNTHLFYDSTNHRLGIGTTTPATQLAVAGTSFFGDNAIFQGTINGNLISQGNGTLSLNSYTLALLGNAVLDQPLTTTSTPTFTGITINGNATTTASQIILGQLSVSATSTLATTSIASLTVGSTINIGTTTSGAQLIIQGVSTSPILPFLTIASSTGLVVFTILPSGSVNIGTSTGASVLTLQGNPSYSNSPLLTVASSSGSTLFTVLANGNLGVNTTTPQALLSLMGTATSTAPLFDVASSTGASSFRVASNGNVTIGTTVPAGAPASSAALAGNLYQGATQLRIPLAAPVITQGGMPGASSYQYVVAVKSGTTVVAVSAVGKTTTGPATRNSTDYNIIATVAQAGSTACDVYSVGAAGSGKIGSVACGASFNDTGMTGDGAIPPASVAEFVTAPDNTP